MPSKLKFQKIVSPALTRLFIDGVGDRITLLLLVRTAALAVGDTAPPVLHCLALLLVGDLADLVVDSVALLLLHGGALVLVDCGAPGSS